MKKSLLFVTLLLAVSALFFSCKSKDDGNSGSTGGGENNGGAIVNVANSVWSETEKTTIVLTDIDNFLFESKLATHIYELTNLTPIVKNVMPESYKGLIVLGKCDAEISVAAYRRLDAMANQQMLDDADQSAWLIYAKDGAVGVAYSDIFAKKEAVEYIIENYKSEIFAPSNGILAKNVFNTLDVVKEERALMQELVYKTVSEKLGAEAEQALRGLYSLYSEDLYVWLANLYDPDIGGFYYSASARDNEGFLPDLESTAQATRILQNSGLTAAYTNNTWTNLLPEDICQAMLAFAQGLQAEDGYFYHPQWGTGISSSRRGRDSGWAKSIITEMGAKPNYPYATSADVDTVSEFLPTPLANNKVSAVSKVVATAANDSIYSSEKAFIAYLDSLKINQNSYSAGNTLNSTSGMIKKYNLRGVLDQYLRDHQNPNNGLWEDEVSYQSVNGLMKLCTFFGQNFPNAEAAMDSAITILKLEIDEELTGITFVYNPWVAIEHLMSAVSQEKKAELIGMLQREAADIFKMTAEKLALFSKPDGGFSYLRDYSSPFSQDALVAVSGSVESDVNATTIAISTVVKYMSSVFKVDFPALFGSYDSIYFIETLTGMTTIIKNAQMAEPPDTITFDDFEDTGTQIDSNVVIYPHPDVTNNIGDKETDGFEYKWFESSVVPNPTNPSDTTDLVLYVADKVYTGEEKSVADTASSTEFKITNMGAPGNCYVFEADLLFAGASSTTAPLAQLTFIRQGTALISAWVDLYQYQRFGQNYIRIQEYFAGADGVKDSEVAAGIPVDDWFKLRVEMYKDYSGEGGALKTMLKFYVNGTLVGISDSGHYVDGAYKDFLVSAVKLSYYRHSASSFYINNVYVAKDNKIFTPEVIGGADDTPVSQDKTVYNFNDGIPNTEGFFGEMFYNHVDDGITSINPCDWTAALEKAYGINTNKGAAKLYSVLDPTSNTNKVIKAYSQNTESSAYEATLYVQEQLLSEGAKTWEVEFDYYFDKLNWIYSANFFSLEFQNSEGSSIAGITFKGLNWEDTKNTDRLGIALSNGKTLENIVLSDATWYTFKVVYHYDELNPQNSMILLYLLGKDGYVCVANEQIGGKYGAIDRVGFVFHCYRIRGAQYIDDVSVSRTNLEYVNEEVSYEEIDIPVVEDNKIYVETTSRGEGANYGDAVKYEGTTYDQLVLGGTIANSITRGDGVEDGTREAGIVDVDGDEAFYYTSYGSGNHALEFVAKNPAMEGLVFETDIKLVGVDTEDGRDIRFTATSTNGAADAALWCFNLKFHKNPNEKIGGYIVTIAGSTQKVVIKDSVWYNMRLVAHGVEIGDDLELYINGELVIKTTLGADGSSTQGIIGATGVEFYTPSSYGGHGFEEGTVYLDNTYVMGLGEPPLNIEITESSRGEGANAANSIIYNGKTYQDLVTSGLMVENTSRGDGIASGKRQLYVGGEATGDAYLRYSSLGSGIHAINFAAVNGVYNGLVFETDIKLNNVDATETRAIRFTASVYNGVADADNWAFNLRFYANPNEFVGGYVAMISGSYDKVYIKNDSWTNFRLVAEGMEEGSALKLYVNGELVIETTLSDSLKNVKGVELFTPSTYGSHGWENGEICLDNTYVGGLGEAPTYGTLSDSSRGEGLFTESAIAYDGTTYDELVSLGKIVQNSYRGSGVAEGKRLLSVVEINGNAALKYEAIGSGNHAVNFPLLSPAYESFIFETDIMLDGVNCDKERAIKFVGTYNNGVGAADLWGLNISIYRHPELSVNGYVLTCGASSCIIPDATWINILFFAEATASGSKFEMHINGEKWFSSTLSESISSIKGVELYTASNSGGVGFSKGSVYLDNTYVSGTGTAPTYPTIDTSSRGEGVYAGQAVNYEGKTYGDLVLDGAMIENGYRESGVAAGNREISIKNDGGYMLSYIASGSGIHSLNFPVQNPAYNGFVFETDIMLSGIINDESRAIAFVGTYNNGKAGADLWGVSIKFYKNPNTEVGGYVIAMNGTNQKVVISDSTWINIRFEAYALANNSSFSFFVNGAKVADGKLTSDISAIKGIELYTPSNSGGYGFVKGSINLDNTYVSGTGTAPVYESITSTSRGEGGYKKYAVSYEGVTYDSLVADGKMAKNTYRGDGISEGLRTLSFEAVGDSTAMVYKALGSGNKAINFVKDDSASNVGFVFETDIMLSGVNNDTSRAISFVGTANNGSGNAALWGLSVKFSKNPDSKVGGYIITLNGTSWQGVIPEATWINIRFEAKELTKGSSFNFYVNGVKVTTGALTASIASIKGVELLTQSNSGGYGFVEGSINLDNTYVGGYVSAISEADDTEIDSGDIDGDAWEN